LGQRKNRRNMLTMDEYKVVDRVYPNYLELGDLIKVSNEVYQVVNLKDTPSGYDVVVLDNYDDTKIISIPDNKLVSLVMQDDIFE
jgi:hypothetical protein